MINRARMPIHFIKGKNMWLESPLFVIAQHTKTRYIILERAMIPWNYIRISKPLTRRDAKTVCDELREKNINEYSELTRNSLIDIRAME